MPNYVTEELFADYVRDHVGTADLSVRAAALLAAESTVNEFCQRSFAVALGTPSTRYFTPKNVDQLVVRIHDCVSVTSIVDDTATVAAADYQLEPVNAVSWSGEACPYEQVRRLNSYWAFSAGEALVAITADWGWSAVPDAVVEATKIIGRDILMQRNVTNGVAGFDSMGVVRVRMNAIAQDMLTPYRRAEAFGLG